MEKSTGLGHRKRSGIDGLPSVFVWVHGVMVVCSVGELCEVGVVLRLGEVGFWRLLVMWDHELIE